MEQCCMLKKNREVICGSIKKNREVQATIEKCKVCQRRHYQMNIEPGCYNITLPKNEA